MSGCGLFDLADTEHLHSVLLQTGGLRRKQRVSCMFAQTRVKRSVLTDTARI